MEEKFNLKDIKEQYKKLQKRYNLPSFEKLNEDFYIEKISGNETEILIREIRRHIADRIYGYLKVVEAIINPTSAPLFLMSIIKSIDEDEKKKIWGIYEKLIKNEVNLMEVDINFSEEKEADYIKEAYKTWQEIKKDMAEVIETVKKGKNQNSQSRKNDYLG